MDSDELAGNCSAAVWSTAVLLSRLDLEEPKLPISAKKRLHGPLLRASLLQVEEAIAALQHEPGSQTHCVNFRVLTPVVVVAFATRSRRALGLGGA